MRFPHGHPVPTDAALLLVQGSRALPAHMNGARGPALGLMNGLAVLGNCDLSSWRGGGSGLRLDLVAGRGDTNGFMQGKAIEPIVQHRCHERLRGLAWCTALPGWLTLSSMRAMEGLAPTLGLIPQRACILHAGETDTQLVCLT